MSQSIARYLWAKCCILFLNYLSSKNKTKKILQPKTPTKQNKTKQKPPMKIPFAENFCSGNFVPLNPNFQISQFFLFLEPFSYLHMKDTANWQWDHPIFHISSKSIVLAQSMQDYDSFAQYQSSPATEPCVTPTAHCPQSWGMLMCTPQAFQPNLSVIHYLAFHSPQYTCKIVTWEETCYFLFIIININIPSRLHPSQVRDFQGTNKYHFLLH